MSTVTVTGHADTVGTEASNLELGQHRADAVKQALQALGVPEDIISADSQGEGPTQAVKTRDEVPNARNRRVEVNFHPEASKLPSLLPGNPKPAERVSPFPPPPDLTYHPKPEPDNPINLPPDYWKPLPPPIKGSGPKSALDFLNEKIVDPVVDAVTKPLGLSQDLRDKVKDLAHSAVEKGITSGLESALDATGLKDPQAKSAILKAAEAAIKEKGEKQGGGP
jgi:hypothetical protein